MAEAIITRRGGGGAKLTGDNVAVANSVAGTTLKLTPPKGCFDGEIGNNVTITDADLIVENIRSGVNLFGLVGNLQPVKFATGATTSSGSQTYFPRAIDGVTIGRPAVSVSGLTFMPRILICFSYAATAAGSMTVYNSDYTQWSGQPVYVSLDGFKYLISAPLIINATNFTIPVSDYSLAFRWIAMAW